MIGKNFGQHEPLTTRIHNLVRSYPKGLGIFKEFIQNADDAEADEIVFVIDEQQYNICGLPESMYWLHTSPSLLIYNNKSFNEADIEGIQRIGASGKSNSIGKTGRFGLGFNACYNITDVPCFFTKSTIYFFDPHYETIPEAFIDSPGRSFGVDELLNEGWSLMDPMRMFVNDEKSFDGTVFRLAFRNDQFAISSKIKNEKYTVEDAIHCVNELRDLGSSILIFLKHIKSLKVEYRKPDGTILELLSIEAINKDEIIKSKSKINSLFSCVEPKSVLNELEDVHEIYSNCIQRYRIRKNNAEYTEVWRVIDGFFVDDNNQAIRACQEMYKIKEKALPYAGAAWKLSPISNKIKDKIFCFLPVPIQSSLPVIINGYFDLDDSRQGMFLDTSSYGSAEIRVKWNKSLLENSVVLAYVRLLETLRNDFGDENIDTFYNTFPVFVSNGSGWESWLISAFYKRSSKSQLIKVSDSVIWSDFTKARFLPQSLIQVGKALIDEGFLPIPNPALPEHIKFGYKMNGIVSTEISPSNLRSLLKEEKDVDCPISEAPRVCLSKFEYVEKILDFCCSDCTGSSGELYGLPLIVDVREHLRTLGLTKYQLYRTKHKEDIEIFCDNPEWFVKVGPSQIFNYKQQETLKLFDMEDKIFIKVLSEYIHEYGKNDFIMRTDTNGILTDVWLQAVFKRLLDSNLDQIKNDIQRIPLVPDQTLHLRKMGSSSTPLLFRVNNEKLRIALLDLSVPLVKGVSKELFTLLTDFIPKNSYIWEVTPCDLIDTLVDQCIETLNEYDQFTNIQESLLNYFGKEDSMVKFNNTYIEKLKKLKIYPITSKEGVVDLREIAYIPQQYSFPNIKLDVTLLKCGELNKWIKLYHLLGVQELSRFHLTLNWILPEFEKFDLEMQINASSWLRDNLMITEEECEKKDKDKLYNAIHNTSFIICKDGNLRAPISVYHPCGKLIKEILGNQVPLPDMDIIYTKEQDRWSEFFKYLGMPTEPILSDIFNYICELANDNQCNIKIDRFQAIFDYIRERIDMETRGNKTISGELSEVLEKLSGIAWIPVKIEPGNLICFKKPKYLLARAADVYFSRVGQLIASQAYITILKPQPNILIQKAMGFPGEISVEIVARHFKTVLEMYAVEGRVINEAEFVKVISQIYRFFEGGTTLDENNIDEESIIDIANSDYDLKANFAEIECIWDQELKCFWKPEHVFKENVKYMYPWRKTIKNSNTRIDRGYDALGRKNKPTIEDWKELLIEISRSGRYQKSNEIIDAVREVLHRIVIELDYCNKTDGEVLVPTRNGEFMSARTVFISDAPWYESILDNFNIPILHQAVSDIWRIHHILNISSLSDSLVEIISKRPMISKQEDVINRCLLYENLIQSNEFINGLKRLLQNEDVQVVDESLTHLYKLKIKCVNKISIDLYLNHDNSNNFLFESETNYYLGNDNLEALLLETRYKYFCNDLAEIINRTLKDRLKNLAPLVVMLNCDPAEISEVLNDLKIRSFSYVMNNTDEEDFDILPQEFPIEDESDAICENNSDTQYDYKQNDYMISKNSNSNITIYKEQNANKSFTSYDEFKDSEKRHFYERKSGSEIEKNIPQQFSKKTNTLNNDGNSQSKSSYYGNKAYYNSNKGYGFNIKKGRRLISYVTFENVGSNLQNIEIDIKIKLKARNIVCDYEKRSGRKASDMPEGSYEYDIISYNQDSGELERYIKVFGFIGEWNGFNVVLLSSLQLEVTKQKADQFWIYIVEFVDDEQNLRLYRIQNPFNKISKYAFDNGWRAMAELDNPVNKLIVGTKIKHSLYGCGIIKEITKRGKSQLLNIGFESGDKIIPLNLTQISVIKE